MGNFKSFKNTTGVTPLRTEEFSKIHIKSNIDAMKILSPDLKRSRARELEKNDFKILKPLQSIENSFFVFSENSPDLRSIHL